MTSMDRTVATLVLVIVALGCTPARTFGDPTPPEVVPGEGAVVSLEATDAPVTELVRMLARAVGVKIVLGPIPDKLVTVKLPGVSADAAVQAICDAAGLKLTKKDDVFIIEPGNIRIEVSRSSPATKSAWRTWDGQLSEDIATRAFEPQRMKVKDDSRLSGTLADLVDDLKAAGVDVSVDPSVTVGLLDTVLELPWHSGRNTVESVLLRWVLSARAGPLGMALLQWLDENGQATDRLRLVPGNKWLNVLGEYAKALGQALPSVTNEPTGETNVNWVTGALNSLLGSEPPPAPLQAKIDLDLDDMPLKDALQAISAKLGKPITLAEGVKADTKVSVHAKSGPIIQVLTDLLRPLGLTITYARGEEFAGITVIPGPPWLGLDLPFSLYSGSRFGSPDR